MNNSFERIIDGMIHTLRSEVIPNVGTEFARGQAFGVIYMLNSIRLRGGWSVDFFARQLAMLDAFNATVRPLLTQTDAPELPDTHAHETATAIELQAVFEAGQERICGLIDWAFRQPKDPRAPEAQQLIDALRKYVGEQIRWEITTSAKPMFAEISSGSE